MRAITTGTTLRRPRSQPAIGAALAGERDQRAMNTSAPELPLGLVVIPLVEAAVALVVKMANVAGQLVHSLLKLRLIAVIGSVGQPALVGCARSHLASEALDFPYVLDLSNSFA